MSQFWKKNVEGGEGLCKHESKRRTWSNAKDECTSEATTALFPMEREQWELESERSGKSGSFGSVIRFVNARDARKVMRSCQGEKAVEESTQRDKSQILK